MPYIDSPLKRWGGVFVHWLDILLDRKEQFMTTRTNAGLWLVWVRTWCLLGPGSCGANEQAWSMLSGGQPHTVDYKEVIGLRKGEKTAIQPLGTSHSWVSLTQPTHANFTQ